MLKMKEGNQTRQVSDIVVLGKRPRGRAKMRWMDYISMDMLELRVTPEDAHDRSFWRARI